MNPIEIRLDPALVAALLDTIRPALEGLETELASAADVPADDDMLENFWKNDLLDSQREEVAAISELFDLDFMESGRAIIVPDNMERVLRACSAIRLRLRDTALSSISDQQLEEGTLEDVAWTRELQEAYAAYSLFGHLQELIVAQIEGFGGDDEEEEGGRGAGDVDL